jgi:hypothetical protein
MALWNVERHTGQSGASCIAATDHPSHRASNGKNCEKHAVKYYVKNSQHHIFYMNRDYGDAYYVSALAEDKAQGWIALELHRTQRGKKDRIARIVFWDASGQFFVETFNADVPLAILEELIAEAKATIRVS